MLIRNGKQIGFIYKGNQLIEKIVKGNHTVYEKGFLREFNGIPPIKFKSVGKNIINYRIKGNTIQGKLPSDYQQVEYIQSTGTQYIDTGYKTNETTEFNLKVETTNPELAWDGCIIGSRTQYNATDSFVLCLNYANLGLHCQLVSGQHQTGGYVLNEGIHTYNYKNGELYINDTRALAREKVNTQSTLNLYIFKLNQTSPDGRGFRGKLYYCKLYDNGILVRDFVPCYRKSDNVIGLYDLVNGVFYTNQGTDTFLKGENAPTPEQQVKMESVGDLVNLYNIDDGTVTSYGITATFSNQLCNLSGTSSESWSDITPWTYYNIEPNKTIYLKINKTLPFRVTFRLAYADSNYNDININAGDTFTTFITTKEITHWRTFISGFSTEDNINIENLGFMISYFNTEYQPFGKYKMSVNIKSKNKLNQSRIESKTQNGITCSYNNTDDTIVLNGTCTSDNTTFVFRQDVGETSSSYILNGKYALSYKIISGTIENSTTNTTIQLQNRTTWAGLRLRLNESSNYIISSNYNNENYSINNIRIDAGVTCNNLKLKIQFEEGDTVTPYQQYYNKNTNIYLDSPLRKIGDYADYIDFETRKRHNFIGSIVFNGSENPTYYNVQGDYFIIQYSGTNVRANSNLISNNFRYAINWGANIESIYNGGSGETEGKLFQMKILSSRLSTIDANGFKTWLSTHNTEVDYILATPTEETIELPEIMTIKNINNLSFETEIQPSEFYMKYKSTI